MATPLQHGQAAQFVGLQTTRSGNRVAKLVASLAHRLNLSLQPGFAQVEVDETGRRGFDPLDASDGGLDPEHDMTTPLSPRTALVTLVSLIAASAAGAQAVSDPGTGPWTLLDEEVVEEGCRLDYDLLESAMIPATSSFAVVRYGNVMGSRGSVIPFFRKLGDEGKGEVHGRHLTELLGHIEQL